MENLISGKYFNLEIDNRFPLTIPTGKWQNLTNKYFDCPKGCSIYLLQGHENFYVGSDGDGDRVYNHKYDFNSKVRPHKNPYMQNVVNKYGLEIFSYQPLIEIPPEYVQFRDEIENSYIKLFDTFHNGYNLAEFADTPRLGMKNSPETRRKISEAMRGNKHPLWGKKHSPESIKKMSLTKMGKKMSPEANKNNAFGHSKNFKMIDPNGKLVDIFGMAEFCRDNNLISTRMINVCKGKTFQHKGWRKFDEKLIGVLYGEIMTVSLNHKFISPMGESVEIINLKSFCRENGLSYGCMRFVIKGIRKQCHGWRKFSDELIGVPFIKRKIFHNSPCKFISPDNKIIEIINLVKFCKENALCYGNMRQVFRGKSGHHHGWTRYVPGVININEEKA